MKSLINQRNVIVAFVIALSSISLPATASATAPVNVVASQTTVAPNESVQFTVDAGNGEQLGVLFAESGTGWILFDRGFVKDLPIITWSTFSPPCDTNVTVIYRVYRTLMVDYDPDNPPQYGDFTSAGLVAGDSAPVEFAGSKCNDGIALVITNDSTSLAGIAGTLGVENVGANKAVTWSITGGANAALFNISATGFISFRTPPAAGTYSLIVTAVDIFGETVNTTFNVVVSPPPVVAPPISQNTGITITGPSVLELAPGQLTVGSFTTSADVKWTISGGNDAALFEISSAGILSFKSEPRPGSYAVIISATDSAGNSTSRSVTITIPVTSSPVISGGSLNPVVNPGDRAIASYSADKFVRWSITGGSNPSLFRISAAGTLSFNSAAVPGTYTVIVTATDTRGNFTNKTVTINVPAPAVVKPREAARVFSGFALSKSTVTPAMRRSIENFVRANPDYIRVSITGFTQGPRVIRSDRALARARANAVGAVIRQINPNAIITIAGKTELAVGSSIRRALVVLTFK